MEKAENFWKKKREAGTGWRVYVLVPVYQRKMSETGRQDLGWSSKPEKTVKGAGSHLGFRLAYFPIPYVTGTGKRPGVSLNLVRVRGWAAVHGVRG